jgi:hypothetical protein
MNPVIGAAWDTISGRNFIGEPTTENPVQFTSRVIVSRALPFMIEGQLDSQGNPAGLVEFFGTRSFPVSLWQRRNDLRNAHALADLGKPWDELTIVDHTKLEADHPDLQEATNRARELSLDRADEFGLSMHDRQVEIDSEREKMLDNLENVQQEFIETGIAGEFTRDKIDNILRSYRDNWIRISENPKYVAALEHIEKMSQDKKRAWGDIAYDEYIANVMGNPELEDKFGNYNFDLRREMDELFKAHWGQDVWDYIQARRTKTRAERPILVQDLQNGRENEAFRSYWELDKDILTHQRINRPELLEAYRIYRTGNPVVKEEMLAGNPIFKQIDAAVTHGRKLLRDTNRELDAFMFRFGYTQTLRHPDNKGREQEILSFGSS